MLLKFSRFFLYISVFSVTVVLAGGFFPFIGGKVYFFRSAVELALIFFLLFWAFEARSGEIKDRFQKIVGRPIFIAVSVFVLFFLLSVVFAYNFYGAFWSNYERGEGGFQMLHYYIFFVLLLLAFDDEKHWRIIFGFSLAAAVLMILYGIASVFLPGFIGPYGSITGKPAAALSALFSDNRFQGSLGNPAYVGPYLMFSVFYTLFLWLSRKSFTGRTLIYLGLAVFFLVFFALSQTRGAFLGLGAAVFFGILYLVFLGKRTRIIASAILAAMIIFAGVLYAVRDEPFVKRLPLNRIFEISLGSQAIQTRAWTWGSALGGIKERPIFGWGPENFSAVFDKYFDVRHFKPWVQSETWFDRAHSVVLDYLAETGVLGFLSYLAIFAVFYWQLFKTLVRVDKKSYADADKKSASIGQNHRGSAMVNALIFALPIGYLVQGLVLFDVLPIYINLFIFIAFANFYFNHQNNQKVDFRRR